MTHTKSKQLYLNKHLFRNILKVGTAGFILSALTSAISFTDFILLVWLLPTHLSFNDFFAYKQMDEIMHYAITYHLTYYSYSDILRSIISVSASIYGLLTLFISFINTGFKIKYGHLIKKQNTQFNTINQNEKITWKNLSKITYPNQKTLIQIAIISNILVIIFSYVIDAILLQFVLPLEVREISVATNDLLPSNLIPLFTNYYAYLHHFIIHTCTIFLYYRIIVLLFLPWVTLFSGIILIEGFLKKDIFINLSTIVLNILFDFIFVYYTNLSINGIALGTVVARVISLIIILSVYFKHIDYRNENIIYFKPRFYLLALCSLMFFELGSFFNSLGQTLYGILFLTLIQIIVPSSFLALSLLGAIMPISNFFNSILIGFTRKTGAFFSISYANNDFIRFKKTFYYIFILMTGVSLCLYFICFDPVVSNGLMYLYKVTDKTDSIASTNAVFATYKTFLFRCYSVTWISTGLVMATKPVYLASNKAGIETIISIVRRWVIYVGGLFIFTRFNMWYFSSNMVWLGLFASLVILISTIIYVEQITKKEKIKWIRSVKLIKIVQ